MSSPTWHLGSTNSPADEQHHQESSTQEETHSAEFEGYGGLEVKCGKRGSSGQKLNVINAVPTFSAESCNVGTVEVGGVRHLGFTH